MAPVVLLVVLLVSISFVLTTSDLTTKEPPEGTGVDCFESCGYKSGTCTTGTCGARNGKGVQGGLYKCCRLGWNPQGDCSFNQGCLNRHCCVLENNNLSDNKRIDISRKPDPTCATGVLSSDKLVCSLATCEISDGHVNCAERVGGEACCVHKVLETAHSCDYDGPPCVVNDEQLSKQILPCPDIESEEKRPSFELSSAQLAAYVNATHTDQKLMPIALDGGASFTDEGDSGASNDVVDLTGSSANVLLRNSIQPDPVTGNGFTVCLWFKATEALDDNGAEFNPLASKWIEGKGWELRVDHHSHVVFVVGTVSGPVFEVKAQIKNGDLASIAGRNQWNHACGIYYGSAQSQVAVLVNGGDLAIFSLPVGSAKYRPVTTVRETRIGRNLGNPRKSFRGLIAGFKVWENRAISPVEMIHISGACGSGVTSGTVGVAVGAPANVYGQAYSATTSFATDNSESTCVNTAINTAKDQLNGKEELVYVQIDLGKEVLVRAVSLVVDPLRTFSDVDIYVGNTGNRNHDAACFLEANVRANKNSLILCRRNVVDSTDAEEVVLATPDRAGSRTMTSVHSNQAHNTHPYGKGSLGSWRGWLAKDNDGNQWQQLDLGRIETVYGVVVDGESHARSWNHYVRSFTVETSLDGTDWIPVADGKVFKGNRQDNHGEKKVRWNDGVSARYVKLRPVTWNYSIRLRWDVIVSPGSVKGRYVTVYADLQLSVCEIRVFPEEAAASRSALCSPKEVQSLCAAPQLETTIQGASSNSIRKVIWLEPKSYLTSTISVISTESAATKLAAVCGMPRLQVKVDEGRWKTVRTIDDVEAEQNGNPLSSIEQLRREAVLLVKEQTPHKLHIGQIRHVACSSLPSNAQSPASSVQMFNWTRTIDSDGILPSAPSKPSATITTATTYETIVAEMQFVVLVDGTVDKYVVVVEFDQEIWFESYTPADLQSAHLFKLPRDVVFNGGLTGSVTFHVFACKDANGCGPPSQLVMSVPKPLQNLKLNEVGIPGSGLNIIAGSSESSGFGDASELRYQVLLGQPMLRFTFEDMNDPLRGTSVVNWGSSKNWNTKGVFSGIKPKLFDRSPGDRAVTIMSGNLQGIEIEWGAGSTLGPPFTIGFWLRSDSRKACTDIFYAKGSEWWNYIRIYMSDDYLKVSLNNYVHESHTRNILRSQDKLPYMEWRYVIVSTSVDQSHANMQKIQLNVLEPNDLASIFERHILIKAGHSCNSPDTDLGNQATLDACAEKCQQDVSCRFFYYDATSSACKYEKTVSKVCTEGWSSGNGNFYETRRAFIESHKNWESKNGAPPKIVRKSKIGGLQACSDTEKKGHGSFSMSDFFIYDRELTNSEKFAEFTIGNGFGTKDLTNHIAKTAEELLDGVMPSGYEGFVDVYAWLCNAFGCSPKVGASLGAPTPPKLLNATVQADGQVVLDFFAPVSTGGTSRSDMFFHYSNRRPVTCSVEEEMFKNPEVLAGLYGRFDAAIGVNHDGTSPKDGEFINNGWHDISGYNRKFMKIGTETGQYVQSGINGLPTVRVSSNGAMALDSAFNGDNYAVYVVARRTSSSGRLISSKNSNWILGWHSGNIGVAHANRWCPNNWGRVMADKVGTGGDQIQRIMSFRATGRNNGKFYIDGKWTGEGKDPLYDRDTCYAGDPGHVMFGAWHRNVAEKAAGDIASLLLYKPAPTEEVHNMIMAYLAWKWKSTKPNYLSDTERSLLGNGIVVNPAKRFCKLEITSGSVQTATISADSSATDSTKYTESPVYQPLSNIADLMLSSCNRFGCSSPAIIRVQPPPAPVISSLRVVSSSAIRIVFQKPTQTFGAAVSFYLLYLIQPSISAEPFRVDRIVSTDVDITHDVTVGVGSESGEWLVATDATLTSLTAQLVSCSVLNCTATPTTISTRPPDAPVSITTRRIDSDTSKIAIDVINPLHDGGQSVSEYRVEWQAFVDCRDPCETFSHMLSGNVITGSDVQDSSSSSYEVTEHSDSSGILIVLPLTVVEWTITVDNIYIAEHEGVVVTQGSSKGALKSSLGTTWLLTISNSPIVSITASVGAIITQGSSAGILQTELTGTVTQIVVTVPVGVVFDSSTAVNVVGTGDTTISDASITNAEATTTELVIVAAAADSTFVTDAPLTIGTTEIDASEITNIATDNSPTLSSALRVKTSVKACNTIGCGDSFSTWNTDVNATVSYGIVFDATEAIQGEVNLQVSWDTLPSETSLTSGDVADSLATLFHMTVPYIESMSSTLRRVTGWIFNASRPDFSSKSIIIGENGIEGKEELDSSTTEGGEQERGRVVYEVFGLLKGEYKLHALSKCSEGHNNWFVSLPGDKLLTWSMPTSENEDLQWDVFQDHTYRVESAGEKIWIELQPEHSGCTIMSLQIGSPNPPYSRIRTWPPALGSPILQEYMIKPYAETGNFYFNNSCSAIRLMNDLCAIRGVVGIIPVNIQGRHCLRTVEVPNPETAAGLIVYSQLLGASAGIEYYDLASLAPNLVKTDGWLATKTGLSNTQSIERGGRVLAIGWNDPNFLDCTGSQKSGAAVKSWTAAEGRSCPESNTACYTIHGPYDRDVAGSKKTFQLSKSHTQIKIKLRMWKADSWDNEQIWIRVDGMDAFESEKMTNKYNENNGFEKVKFCAYEKQGNYGHLFNGVFEVTVPHTKDSVTIEIASNLGSTHTDEWFGFDQFEFETISSAGSVGGIFDVSKSSESLEIDDSIQLNCGPASPLYTHQPYLAPPTQLTDITAYPDTCYDPPNQCIHKSGTIQLKWREPRSWGYNAAYSSRRYEIEYIGLVVGVGLIEDSDIGIDPENNAAVPVATDNVLSVESESETGSVDSTDDSASTTDLASSDDPAAELDVDSSAVLKWPVINGTCADCFNHTGTYLLHLTHLSDFLLKNLYQSVQYSIRVRAVTSVGGSGEWSENKLITSYNDADPPFPITEEPVLIVAEPERMKIRWLIPDWRGSPVTELIIERSAVGQCGLAVLEWNPTQEIIPINPRDYVNMPLPHYIDVWVGNCLDENGDAIEGCTNRLESDTDYVFRAKAVNTKGAATDFSKCCSKSLRSGVSQAFVDVSTTIGNDTLCSENDPGNPKQIKVYCQTIHNALKFNEFENVHLRLHPGLYNAHPNNDKAVTFKRNGMGLTGAGNSRTDAILNCNRRSCIDIDSVQKYFAPISLRKLTFRNASTQESNGDRSRGDSKHLWGGAVIRLVGQHDISFTGIEISNCVFELNTADVGGAVFADCSHHAFTLRFQDVLFQNNVAHGAIGAGALRVHNCSTEMSYVTFSNNHATKGGGGAARFSLGSLRITDSLTAIDNKAGGRDGGGAFRINGTALTMADQHHVCRGNKATHPLGYGGACLYAEYATMDVRGWNVSFNLAETQGGAIRCMGSKLNVRNSMFDHNEAKKDGGSISGMLCNSEFIGSTFSSNSAGVHELSRIGVGFGGAIHLGPGSGALIRSSTFRDNVANAGGGAFSCDACDGDAVVYNTSFLANRARVGGAIALYESHIKLRALGWGVAADGQKFTSINTTLDATGHFITNASTFTATFSSSMVDYVSIGQQFLLTSFSEEMLATAYTVESAQVLLIKITQIVNEKVTMKVLSDIVPDDVTNSSRSVIQVPKNDDVLNRLYQQLKLVSGYSIHQVPTSQIFKFNKANESGGGAIYWDSPDVSDSPYLEPIKGAGTFISNEATYGKNFASAGSTLKGSTYYTANNTLPFSPIVHLEDYYSQTVVNYDISQSITVFAKASDKLFGKTDSTMESSGYAYFPTVGMAAEPGIRNCSFVSSSSRITDFSVSVDVNDCNPGTFLRNQESEVRINHETATGKKLRYDERLDCPKGEFCRWECVNCPIGRYTSSLSLYSCNDCPEGFIQPYTGQVKCEQCSVGKYARERAASECDNAEIDITLPSSFQGLRFLADSSSYLNTLTVQWDNEIDVGTRQNVQGIQVRVSLGNAAFFDSKVIAERSIDLSTTSVVFDLSSEEIEKRCKIVLHGLFCLPAHLMKYYTQVRLYTNNGKVGQSAFPAETWSIASECSNREYLDDYSCPLCEQMRSDLQNEVNGGNIESSYQLLTLPSIDEVLTAATPHNRLLNPLMWECMECPEGGTCQGDILYSGIVSLFGWWRVETGIRPETFQRCLFPPACLGAPNLDLAGRYYDKECTDACKVKCNSTKSIVGEEFDQGSCDYKCGFETSCDIALFSTIDCGGSEWWGKETYSGSTGWPGYDSEPTIDVQISSFLFDVAKGNNPNEKKDCKTAVNEMIEFTTNDALPSCLVPTCDDDKWKSDLGESTQILSVHLMALPKFSDIVPSKPPTPNFAEEKVHYFYTNDNHTIWSINATRNCLAYQWVVGSKEDASSSQDTAASDTTKIEEEYTGSATTTSSSSSSSSSTTGFWKTMETVCPTTMSLNKEKTKWKGLSLPWSDGGDFKVRDYGTWIIYDMEEVEWWDNTTLSRYNEIRGFIYSAINDPLALQSEMPIASMLVNSPGAKLLEIAFSAKSSDVISTDDNDSNDVQSTYIKIRKSQKTICNMGFEDPTKTTEYSRCDSGLGLVCEKCDVKHGYMQECINPKGSRCRLCASCAAGYKRAGESRCKLCPDVTSNRILLVVGILAMIMAASILIYMVRNFSLFYPILYIPYEGILLTDL